VTDRKRKKEAKNNDIRKKAKTGSGEKEKEKEKETDGGNSIAGSVASNASKEGENKKKVVMFNDHDVHINLYNEAPQNIKMKKIKLSQSLLILCQMIEGSEMKGSYSNDFAALTFQKKMKDGKAYEFSLPLALAPVVQTAIQLIIDSNPNFFSGSRKSEKN
jgi:hypothetical protein